MKLFLKTIVACFFLILTTTYSLVAQSTDKWTEENRVHEDFNQISAKGPFTVLVSEGPETKVHVQGYSKLTDVLQTVVENNVLKIHFKDNVAGLWRSFKADLEGSALEIRVTVPKLTAVSLEGNGKLAGEDIIKAESFAVSLLGKGFIDLKTEASSLSVNLQGTGTMKLGGTVGTFAANLKGSGNIEAFELDADKAVINVDGSGQCEITVNEDLIANTKRSGEIRYKAGVSTKPLAVTTTTKGKNASVTQIED